MVFVFIRKREHFVHTHTHSEHLKPLGFPVVNGMHPVKGLAWTWALFDVEIDGFFIGTPKIN